VFKSRNHVPTVRALAERAGWRETKQGWLCESCKREEPAEEKEKP
jgi:hypothetical protein